LTGKRSFGDVVTLIPGSMNGFVRFRCVTAFMIPFRVGGLPAFFSASTNVQATAIA
jgi:hypothetical protein